MKIEYQLIEIIDKKHFIKWVVIILLLLVFTFGLFKVYYKQGKEQYTKVDEIIIEQVLDIVYGSDTASIEIFMYSSYSCGFCRTFLMNDFPLLKKEFVDKGIVKFIIKPVEITNDANMILALKTAVCINEYGDFTKLNELLIVDPKVVYSKEFIEVTDEFIDRDLLVAECMLSGISDNYLENNIKEFKSLNLTGTPTFIINNIVYKGYKSHENFKKVIQKELRKNKIFNFDKE